MNRISSRLLARSILKHLFLSSSTRSGPHCHLSSCVLVHSRVEVLDLSVFPARAGRTDPPFMSVATGLVQMVRRTLFPPSFHQFPFLSVFGASPGCPKSRAWRVALVVEQVSA